MARPAEEAAHLLEVPGGLGPLQVAGKKAEALPPSVGLRGLEVANAQCGPLSAPVAPRDGCYGHCIAFKSQMSK